MYSNDGTVIRQDSVQHVHTIMPMIASLPDSHEILHFSFSTASATSQTFRSLMAMKVAENAKMYRLWTRALN